MKSFFCLDRLKFNWHAQNAHGIHSPFVFDFYTAVKKESKKNKPSNITQKSFTKKQSKIIRAILSYLKPQKSLLLLKNERQKQFWTSLLVTESQIDTVLDTETLNYCTGNYDFILIDSSSFSDPKEFLSKIEALISNQSFVIIPLIHASKLSINRWQSLIKDENIHVSMDLFFLGILFFRKESTKQDFKLRF